MELCVDAPWLMKGYSSLESCQLLAGLWEVGSAWGPGRDQSGMGGRRGPAHHSLAASPLQLPPSAPVESVLASVYVQLALSNQTWPLAISRTLTRPLASASSFPRTLTGLSLTTGRGDSTEPCLSVARPPLMGGMGAQREGDTGFLGLLQRAHLDHCQPLPFPGGSPWAGSFLTSPPDRPFPSCSMSPSSKLWQRPKRQTVVGRISPHPPNP